jgi:ABC-type cobalamin transport system ATPase subunit
LPVRASSDTVPPLSSLDPCLSAFANEDNAITLSSHQANHPLFMA